MSTITHDHKLKIWPVKGETSNVLSNFGFPWLGLRTFCFWVNLTLYSSATVATTKRSMAPWIFEPTSHWGVNIPPQIDSFWLSGCFLSRKNVFECPAPATSAIRVWACSSLCISVLTECKETLTQEPFPHRDRYTVYILLFSVMHILQERFQH